MIVTAIRIDFDGLNNITSVFTCEAMGMPRPDISWEARNDDTLEVVPVTSGDNGILIITMDIGQAGVISNITFLVESNFSRPRCTASNGNGNDVVGVGGFVTITGEFL